MQAAFLASFLNGFEQAVRRLPGVRRTRRFFVPAVNLHSDAGHPSRGAPDLPAIVHVEFDPTVVSYERLLALFWDSHDPTVGPEPPGAQQATRSTIYYYDDDQRIRASMAKIQIDRSGRFDGPTATRILPAPGELRDGVRPDVSHHTAIVGRSAGEPDFDRDRSAP